MTIKYPEHSDWTAWLSDIGMLDSRHENCPDALSCVAQREVEDDEYAF